MNKLNRYSQFGVPLLIVLILLSLAIVSTQLVESSGPGDEDIPFKPISEIEEGKGNWVYGKIEYFHDLLAPNRYFMLLRAHPGSPVPMIEGGYATTDVYLDVILRGVDVARAVQNKSERTRPHDFIDRERQRWDSALHYVWNLTEPNRTFRVGNMVVIEEDKAIMADMDVLVGGTWHSLALFMIADEHARPTQIDGQEWDFGSRNLGTINSQVPK